MWSFGILVLEEVTMGQLIDSWPLSPEVVGGPAFSSGPFLGHFSSYRTADTSPPPYSSLALLSAAPAHEWPHTQLTVFPSAQSLLPCPAAAPPHSASLPDSALFSSLALVSASSAWRAPASLPVYILPKWPHDPMAVSTIYMLTIRNLYINSDLSQNSGLTSNCLLGISRWRSN